MWIEAVGMGFTYKWPGEEVRLEPGKPVDLPPERAARLLARASGRVRQIQEPVVIEPAAPHARPVFWEQADGQIVTANPQFLAKAGHEFWLCVVQGEAVAWVRADQLRSQRQFQRQIPLEPVELIREAGQ